MNHSRFALFFYLCPWNLLEEDIWHVLNIQNTSKIANMSMEQQKKSIKIEVQEDILLN